MVKVNGKEVEWERAPYFTIGVQRQVLWKDEQTGASFVILKIPKGEYVEQVAHSHPHANQFTFFMSGEMEHPDGRHISFPEDSYDFNYSPKNEKHGASQKGFKVLKDVIYIHYWDGPDDWDDSDKD